ncbi:MAG TPA: M15 family metallopeptidase [Jiangellaceae bacterium]|nr:M15 family metallopeptidase [Jiangellaceae bacterium]
MSNGQLGDAHLCRIGDGHLLRPDAAAAFLALDDVYTEEFGTGICVGDSYRSLSEQYVVNAQKPYLAASPGTSNHGWGLALDLPCGADTFGGQAYQWLDENGSDFGWHNPPWARAGGSKPEAWHWEFDPSLLD